MTHRFLRRDGRTVGAARESTIWGHVAYFLVFIAVLVAAVNAAGGHVVIP